MSRRRYISTEISVDKRIRQLSDAAALLYTWMIPHAEEDATITSDPDELCAIVVPNRPGWTPGKMDRCLAEIAALDLIAVQNGTVFFPPASFYRYQSTVHVARRRTEQPPQTGTNSAEQRRTVQNSASPSPSPSPSKHMSGKPDAALEVFEHWRLKLKHPGAQFSPERRQKIEARLKDGLTVERLKEAIDGCASSAYHMGENETGTVYDSVELIFRNVSKVDEFADKVKRREKVGQVRDTFPPPEPPMTEEEKAASLAECQRTAAEVQKMCGQIGRPM